MNEKLHGKRIAILATIGFEEAELVEPKNALEQAGARVAIVSPGGKEIRGWAQQDWGQSVKVDVPLDRANPADYDGLVLPGGVMNPDKLRMNSKAVDFVKHFFDVGKPVAAICHGPWLLVEADVVRGRRVTSWPSVKTDLRNAGAEWVDEQVVVDNGLVTSRKPADLSAFNQKMLEEFKEGIHQHEHTSLHA